MAYEPKVPVFIIEKITVPIDTWVTYLQKNPQGVKIYTNIIDEYNLAGLFFNYVYRVS